MSKKVTISVLSFFVSCVWYLFSFFGFTTAHISEFIIKSVKLILLQTIEESLDPTHQLIHTTTNNNNIIQLECRVINQQPR